MTAEYPVGHYVSRMIAIEHILGGGHEHLRALTHNVATYKIKMPALTASGWPGTPAAVLRQFSCSTTMHRSGLPQID
jgi:hypothetical protein